MRKVNRIALRLMKVLIVMLVLAPYIACWTGFYAPQAQLGVNTPVSFLIMGLFLVFYIMFARIYNGFDLGINRLLETLYSQALAVVIADGFMFVVLWILQRNFPDLWPALITLTVQLVLVAIWSVATHFWYFSVFPPRRSAVVYGKRYRIRERIKEYGMEQKFEILWTAPATQCIRDLSMLEGLQTVFISGVGSHDRNVILKYCAANNIEVYLLPRIGDVILSGAKRVPMFHLPMLFVSSGVLSPEQRLIKRLFDIVFSAAALLISSPIMLAVAIAIKVSDGGPVFYRQERLTRGGKVFKIIKFRSMRVDADKYNEIRPSSGDDDWRITPVGKVIRKLRIDELPQLINVLMGSMSVVGPRPEWVELVNKYEKDLPEFRLRLRVKAGLTGYAQVYGKYNTTPYDKLQMDLMYISNPSLLVDLRILLATVKILFMPESTDGFKEDATAAAKERAEEDEPVGAGKA